MTADAVTPRWPVVDAHNHLGAEFGGGWDQRPVEELLDVLDEAGVARIVNLDGGWGEHVLDVHLAKFKEAAPERFHCFGGVDWSAWGELGDHFPEWAAKRLVAQVGRGAEGLKVWKPFGLHVVDHTGVRVAVDDPRLEPLWQTAADLHVPVTIHVADPVAFFQPLDRDNARYEELLEHPDWHVGWPGAPSFDTLIDEFARLVTRHRSTVFIGAHVGCYSENLAWVAALLARCPNLYVDIGARIDELSRQRDEARRLFVAHRDRILFGTDYPAEVDMYRVHYRFLQTADADFSAANGDRRLAHLSGLCLPEDVLQRVYLHNATRALQGLPPSS
jgi:hypothetical protein